MKMRLFVSLTLCILLLSGCKKEDTNQQDMQNLKNTIKEFYSALARGDSPARFALFTKNSLMLPDNGDLVVMTDSVKKAWADWDDDYIFRIKDLEHVEIDMSGDIAYTINSYYYTWHDKESDPEWHKTKNVHIWKKQNDGTWKLRADIWNNSDRTSDQ